jgi:hypothetical protein
LLNLLSVLVSLGGQLLLKHLPGNITVSPVLGQRLPGICKLAAC